MQNFQEGADFGLSLARHHFSQKKFPLETDLTQLLDKLETSPIAQNETLFEGYKCPDKVKTLKIVFWGQPAL